MDCLSAKPRLSPLLDDALPAAEAEAVRAHVRFCAGCTGALEGLRGLSARLKALPQRPLPAGFHERLSRRRAQGPSPREPLSLQRLLPAAFAAAALALGVVYLKSRPDEAILAGQENAQAALSAQLRRDPSLPAPAAPALPPATPPQTPAEAQFTNDDEQAVLAQERDKLGIKTLDAAQQAPPPDDAVFHGSIGAPENRAAVDATVQELAETARQIRQETSPEVAIAGKVAPVLGQAEESGLLTSRPPVDRWRGDFSSAPPGTRTITDAVQWQAVWRLVSSEPAPAVDFARREVVAVFLGAEPTHGYSVDIVGAVATPTALVVQYAVAEPPAGSPAAEGETAPYVLLSVPKSELPVRFERFTAAPATSQ